MPNYPRKLSGKGPFPVEWNKISDLFVKLFTDYFRAQPPLEIRVDPTCATISFVGNLTVIKEAKLNEDLTRGGTAEVRVVYWDDEEEAWQDTDETFDIDDPPMIPTGKKLQEDDRIAVVYSDINKWQLNRYDCEDLVDDP